MSSKFIYHSEKVLPYVYKLTHKQTYQYYFGYRSANKSPSSKDIGIKYFSSSKTVKELGFDNFEIVILAEFFDAIDAFNFETLLIEEHITDKLNINKALRGKLYPSRKYTSEAHRAKLSKAAKGKKLTAEHIEKSKKARAETISKLSNEEDRYDLTKCSTIPSLTDLPYFAS